MDDRRPRRSEALDEPLRSSSPHAQRALVALGSLTEPAIDPATRERHLTAAVAIAQRSAATSTVRRSAQWRIAAVAAAMATFALGGADALPSPAQRTVSAVADLVGIDIPDGSARDLPTTVTVVPQPEPRRLGSNAEDGVAPGEGSGRSDDAAVPEDGGRPEDAGRPDDHQPATPAIPAIPAIPADGPDDQGEPRTSAVPATPAVPASPEHPVGPVASTPAPERPAPEEPPAPPGQPRPEQSNAPADAGAAESTDPPDVQAERTAPSEGPSDVPGADPTPTTDPSDRRSDPVPASAGPDATGRPTAP